MYILGISAYYHDSAACLIKGSKIIAAVQEERFTRIKHDSEFPSNSIRYCLNEAAIDSSSLDYIVFYEKPFLKFERLLETYLAFAPYGFKSFSTSMPIWIKNKLFQKNLINRQLKKLFGKQNKFDNRLLFSEHHLSHASSAFYPSPFNEAAILTMDGVGEWATTSLSIGKENQLRVVKEIHFPHSLGLLYSAFTYYLGFKVNSGEYKIMGLAPYGEAKYTQKIKDNLIDIKEDGSFQLDISYFDYCTSLTMTNSKFNNLFGGPHRKSESEITQKDMDLAASIQKVTEEIVIKLARDIAKNTGQKNLCLAGGVALNCVANGALLREKIFDKIWIQPAAGDAGGALGAALGVYHIMLNMPRQNNITNDLMNGSYLGPSFNNDESKKILSGIGAKFIEYKEKDLIEYVATSLTKGEVIGWMNGRMEFGPRALGSRSIIADPRSTIMQKQLNLKVKYRESFRPFAPSILREDLTEWFKLDVDSPYMLLVANIMNNKKLIVEEKKLLGLEKINLQRSVIPAVTHVDYSARIHTVHKETNPRFYDLITKFKELTGCPLLINTSFNVRGEPIVCTPEDAFKCFMATGLNILIVNNLIIKKEDQHIPFKENYKNKYKLD